jgi:hypothetical protein
MREMRVAGSRTSLGENVPFLVEQTGLDLLDEWLRFVIAALAHHGPVVGKIVWVLELIPSNLDGIFKTTDDIHLDEIKQHTTVNLVRVASSLQFIQIIHSSCPHGLF